MDAPRPPESEEHSALLDGEALSPFLTAFRRRDQARCFRLYLNGLLRASGRKSVEAIVRAVAPSGAERGLSQALQNFINQSPWDERILWTQIRQHAKTAFGYLPWVGVLDEVGIVKQGRHSVGVQRQYAGGLDRKQNCQVAVVLMAIASEAAFPLGVRLYLPRNWLSDPDRLDGAGVPMEHRQSRSRGELALELLDEAAAGATFSMILAPARFAGQRDFREELQRRCSRFAVSADSVASINDRGDADARCVAHGNLRLQLHGAFDESTSRSLFDLCEKTRRTLQTLLTRFGLEHYEGRSWRGFHHHAALAALAYWLWLTESRQPSIPADVVF